LISQRTKELTAALNTSWPKEKLGGYRMDLEVQMEDIQHITATIIDDIYTYYEHVHI
jgi:hypothetical protein